MYDIRRSVFACDIVSCITCKTSFFELCEVAEGSHHLMVRSSHVLASCPSLGYARHGTPADAHSGHTLMVLIRGKVLLAASFGAERSGIRIHQLSWYYKAS